MSNKDLKISLLLKATDTMSSVVKSACRQSDAEFEKMNKTLEATAGKFDDVGKKSAMFGGALLAASGLNAKMAGDFEEGMNNVSTLIDTNVENLEVMGAKVKEIGKSSPKSLKDLTDGLYSIRSAGISAEDQFNVLKGSEKLAVAGLASTAEAVDITTSAINAFNLKGEEQIKMYDTLFKVVKYGKTNISEFAQGFGSVAGVVASSDVKLDEYSAAVAAMTTTGLKANNAHTQMSAALASLTRSSKEQTVIFNQLGAKSFKDLVSKSGGMVNAFKRIEKAVGGDEAKMVALMGSINGYKAVMGLTTTVNKKFNETLEDMRNGSDALSGAYAKQADGFNNQMKILGNNMQILGIKLGDALLPILKTVSGAAVKVADALDKMPDGLVSFISIAAAGTGAIALFGGTALMATGSIIKNIIFLRKILRTSSIVAWANPAILPIMGVVAGVTALAGTAVFCYNKFEGFRNMCDGVWAVIKAGSAWIAVLWQNFLTGAGVLWDFISPVVKVGVEILKWTTPIGLVIQGLQKLFGWFGKIIQAAGGLRGIGKNIKKWAGDSQKRAEEVNEITKANRKDNKAVDGSHANGLWDVPFDGYRAELHKHETVLTEPQANRWRKEQTNPHLEGGSKSLISGWGFTLNYSPKIDASGNSSNVGDLTEKIRTVLKEDKENLVRMISEVLNRQYARSY